MTLTILPRVILVAILATLMAPIWADELKDHKLRPKFTPRECEAWLARYDAALRANLTGGFRDAPVIPTGVERVGVSRPSPIDLARHDVGFIWFTSPADARAEDVAREMQRAREIAGGDDEPASTDVSVDQPHAPLSDVEKDALGLDFSAPVGPRGLKGRARATAEGWRITWFIRDREAGALDLPTRDAQIGYSNSVYEFQWEELALQRARGRKRFHRSSLENFMESNGHAFWLRTSAASGRRFGYGLRAFDTPDGRWIYQFEVVAVRPTPRQAASPADVIFPGAHQPPFGAEHPQTMNLRLMDLGLRLPLSRAPASE